MSIDVVVDYPTVVMKGKADLWRKTTPTGERSLRVDLSEHHTPAERAAFDEIVIAALEQIHQVHGTARNSFSKRQP